MNPKNINFGTHFWPILGAILGPKWAPKLVQNWFFLGLVFGPVFVDFEILGGRPAVARGSPVDTLCPGRSLGRPRARYQKTTPGAAPVPFTKHPTDLTRPGPRAGEFRDLGGIII